VRQGEQAVKNAVRKDQGFITGKGLVGILIAVFLVYTFMTFLPVASVPFSLDGEINTLAERWLKKVSRDRKKSEFKQFERNLRSSIASHLGTDHEYKDTDLRIDGTFRSNRIVITLPYKIVVNYIGFEFKFDKELYVEHSAWHF
jgi:hypothetical protein